MGLELRGMRESDLDQTCALLVGRGEEADEFDLRLMVDDPDVGMDAVAVVVDGDRVVSTLTLLDETVYLGGVAVPVGQVDLVATDTEYEGRGLVRDLMAWAHRRSRERGHLAQVMIGIPYFYRQFGYTYAVPMTAWRSASALPSAPEGVEVRRATEADIPAMHALHEQAAARADLRMPHSPACWRWVVRRAASHQLVAVRGDTVIGTGRYTYGADASLGELAASDPDGALAVLAHCARADELVVNERPGTIAGDAVEPYLEKVEDRDRDRQWYYARIEDFGALLTHLGPLLASRLPADAEPERLLISSFRSHVAFTIGPDGLTDLVSGRAEQAPGSKGGCGVPPDALPSLVFGPHGAAGLERLLPDCYLAGKRDLMAALFPPLTSDLLTFYVDA
jgi:hypothetical protein